MSNHGDARLLPPNRTALESALAAVSAMPLSTDGLRHLWSAKHCLLAALPWLSWALTVEGWSDATSEDAQRGVILDSINIHRRKGTPWAIRALIRALGFGEVIIIERVGGINYDGTTDYDGTYPHQSAASSWATYKVVFTDRPLSNAQAARLRALLPSVAPARCHLLALRYSTVSNSYNGATQYNGTFNHGSA